MLKPFFQQRTRDWRMVVPPTSENHDKLVDVPGLGFTAPSTYRGMIDAVAAAAVRLKVPPPPAIKDSSGIKTELPLKQYQSVGVSALASILQSVGGALLADDMGLGKTLQTIALANVLQSQRILVAAPRFMSMGWLDELTKWKEPDHVIITPGETKRHKAAWDKAVTAKWVISSYEMLGKVVEKCFFKGAPDFLVFDEAHMVKNVGAGRTQLAYEVATLTPFKLAITATPMWSRPRDFFGILKVLFGPRFGSRTSFFTAYCGGKINEHGGLEAKGATNEEELKLRLSYYMVRREKKDVLQELPSLTRQVIWLDPDNEGTKALKAAVLNKKANATYDAIRATAEAKMDAACELAKQARRFVMFTYERKHAEQLGKKLDLMGTPNVVIHGGLPVERRQERIGSASTNGWGIVATIDSLGAGVNLQDAASTGIMHTLDWVPLKLAQAEARIHRMGQKDPVTWYYLACKETMDEIVIRNIVEKLDQWRAIIGHDSNRSLRDSLSDSRGSEEDALKAIFSSLEG